MPRSGASSIVAPTTTSSKPSPLMSQAFSPKPMLGIGGGVDEFAAVEHAARVAEQARHRRRRGG